MLTPIMSISGGMQALEDLIEEYRQSVGNSTVTVDDHLEIAGEMKTIVKKVNEFVSYMSNVLYTVKAQTIQTIASESSEFTIKELIEQIEFLICNNHDFRKFQININKDISDNISINGDITGLVMIIRNLINNAVQSYDDMSDDIIGKVDISIETGEDKTLIKVQDYGNGISEVIKSKIFKSMFTTKGKHGNGLSLMLSYSAIKAKFGGDMWFESEINKGSEFYISIPIKENDKE